MRRIWLLLALVGTVVPYYYIIPFFVEYGIDIPLFFELLFANSVSQFFAIDLVISSVAFLLWSYTDAKKNKIPGWWTILGANKFIQPEI